MPDQWGRPVIQDWMGIAQSVNAIGDIQDKTVKRERDNKEYERNEKVIDYKTKIASGKLDPAFDATKDIPDVYSTKDALWAEQARASYVQEAAQTEQGQLARQKNREAKAELGYKQLDAAKAQARNLLMEGNKGSAVKVIAEAFSNANGPHSATVNKSGGIDLYITEDGEKKKLRSMTVDEAIAEAEKITQEKYYMYSIANDELSAEANTQALFNHKILQDKKGNQLQMVVQHDPKTRKNRWTIYKDGALYTDEKGKPYSKEDVFKQGFTETTKKEIKADAKEVRDEKRLENEDKRLAAADKRNAVYEEYTQAQIDALNKKANKPEKETATDRKAKEEKALKHLLGSLASDNINLQQDPEGRIGGQVTHEQLNKIKANARKRGFQVYSQKGELDSPVIGKDTQYYNIVDIVPAGSDEQESPAKSLIRQFGNSQQPKMKQMPQAQGQQPQVKQMSQKPNQVEKKEETKSSEKSKIENPRVDKNGIIWGTVNGVTRRIKRRPPKEARDGKGKLHPNPKYDEYQKLLSDLGLDKSNALTSR